MSKKSYDHTYYNTCKAAHWLITLIKMHITPLVDSNQDSVRVRRCNFHFWNILFLIWDE